MLGYIRSITAVSRPRVVGAVSACHGVNEFYSIVIPPIIPLLVTELGISYVQAGLLLTIFFVMYSIFQLPAGILSDKIGKGRLIILGLSGMSVGIFMASFSMNFEMLLVAQAIAGISGSTFHPSGMALISDAETKLTEGKAMGVFGSLGKAGTMGAPLLVGGIAAVGGWRIALAGAAIAGLVVTIILAPLIWRRGTGRQKLRSGRRADGGQFTTIETVKKVIQNIEIPISKQIVILFCITILISIQSRAVQTFTTAYIVEGMDTSISMGNVAFFAFILGGTVSQLIAGSMADQYNRKIIGAVSSLCTAILVGGTILVSAFGGLFIQQMLIFIMVIWMFMIGSMMYAVSPIKNALVSEHAGEDYSGGLFGVIQTASSIGSASGPALFGVIATKWGIMIAYPIVAVVSLTLCSLFMVLWWSAR